MAYPFFNNDFMMKTPQQYQQEYEALMGRIQPQGILTNTGSFRMVDSYQDVENAQVSMTGVPTLFVLNNGNTAWLKKWQNGQAFISAYSFSQVNSQGTPQKKELSMSDVANILNDISTRLGRLENQSQPKSQAVPQAEPKGKSNNVFGGIGK